MDYQTCEDCGIELDLTEIQQALWDGRYLCDSCRLEQGCEDDEMDEYDIVFKDDWEN